MTTGIHQQDFYCSPTGSRSATSPVMIRTSHRLTPYKRTGPVCADKHTAVVPCGSHPTGLGWLDQGGISVADAPVRRVMPPSLFEPMYVMLFLARMCLVVCGMRPGVSVVSCRIACLDCCHRVASLLHTYYNMVRRQHTIQGGYI